MSSSPRRLVRLVAAAFLLLSLLVAGGPGLARAQDAPASSDDPLAGSKDPNAKGPARNEWALTPTGDNPAEPGSRSNFSYELAPGATVHDSATVWNYSDQQLAFRVYARDAFNTPSGGFDLLRRDQDSTDAGSWVTLEQNSMIVPPHSGIATGFTIAVPADAGPGDHAAGIVAATESDATATADGKDQNLLVEHRAGSRLFVRVAGPLNPSLVVDSVSTSYHRGFAAPAGGDLEVTYTVRNAGNVRLSAHQKVEASGLFGIPLGDTTPDDLPELLPGSTMTLTQHVDGVLPTVRVTGAVTIEPFSADGTLDPPPDRVTRSGSSWAVPWLFLGILVALVVGARYLRRRRRAGGGRSGRSRPGGAGGPGGPGRSGGDTGTTLVDVGSRGPSVDA